MERIIRNGDNAIYVDSFGREFVIYKGIQLFQHTKYDWFEEELPVDPEPQFLEHYMAFIVENMDGGACVGFFYITGFDDDDLINNCRKYIQKRYY